MVIKISVIGYKNQAAKLIDIIKKKECQIEWIYHPTKSLQLSNSTNNFSDLYNSDGIIIASPNETHFSYISKLLSNFSGYIFCEKPPVVTEKELKKLETVSQKDKQRLFFNFNLRFGDINDELETLLKNGKVGDPIFANIVSSQGYVFKPEYEGSWRSDGVKNLHNILDATTIHFIDLLSFHFGKISDYTYYPNLFSKHGTSFDTVHLILKFNSGFTASILNSYATPYHNEFSIIGTNGLFFIKNDELQIYSPRDTFDTSGFFKTPPLVLRKSLSFKEEFETSIEKSLNYFLRKIKKNQPIETKLFKTSMLTTRFTLEVKSKNRQAF